MGSSRVRRPETEIIPISQGDTITVKKFLTAGEFRELIRAATKPVRLDAATAASGKDLAFEIDPTESGVATVLAYLLDWTFLDFDGRPLVIRDQPPRVVRAALDIIDADSYMEVQRAIQEHDSTVRAFAAVRKKNDVWRDTARTDFAICRLMGWTLEDVWNLPVHYYDFLIEELNEQAEKVRE